MAIRKIDLMHKIFGPAPGHACRESSKFKFYLEDDDK